MFRKDYQKTRGITLIALVITIIVLLILAGVSIAMLTGQNGILTQANNAKIEQSHGAVKDCMALAYNEYQIEINTGSTEKLASTTKVKVQGREIDYLANQDTFMDFLLAKGYITDKTSGKINVEKLTGAKQPLGNGQGDTDIYKIEENNGTYVVNYYNEDGTPQSIWNTNSSIDSGEDETTATREDFFEFDEETGTIIGIAENTSKDPNGIGYYYDDDDNKIVSEENIVVPEKINGVTVTSIGREAFSRCPTVKSIILPNTITEIERAAFSYCTGLTSMIIPDSVTYIRGKIFTDCTNLKEVKLSNNLRSLGDYEFNECTSLTNLVIPSSVKSIFSNSFANCTNLTSIVLEKDSPLEIPENKWGATNAEVTKEQ